MEPDAGLTSYELRVKRNIEENQRVLKSLGLLNTSVERRDIKQTVRRNNVAVKRRDSFRSNDDPTFSPSLPARRTRRSSSFLKSQGYNDFDEIPVTFDEENTPPHKKKKIAPECVFGPIAGVNVGDWWQTRLECSGVGVHRPTVAGIHGKTGEGCYSIALSGGYEDDVDFGEYFTYTGSGGRDLKGTKSNPKNLRTAPQTKDQVLDGPNAHLALNVENHRPVRVIRGYKLQSPFAPEEGYRYDGLYSVERCWTAIGLAGFKVYKYALKRLPDQDPPPWPVDGKMNSTVESKKELKYENNALKSPETAPDEPVRLRLTINSRLHNSNSESTIITNIGEKNEENGHTNTKTFVGINDLCKQGESGSNVPNYVQENSDKYAKLSFVDCQVKIPQLNITDLIKSPNIISKQICNVKTTNSTKKRVSFSPEVRFKYPEPLCWNCENENSDGKLVFPPETGETGQQAPIDNSSSDGKIQTSILKYFLPIKKSEEMPMKKSEEKQSTSRGILLRGNRHSFNTPIIDSESLKNTVTTKNSLLPQNKSRIESKGSKKQFTKSTSIQEKMETDISSTSKNSNSALQKKDCPNLKSSLVKHCSVRLVRLSHNYCENYTKRVLESTFTGWDSCDEEGEFLGFDCDEEPQNYFYGFDESSTHSNNLIILRSLIKKHSAGS